MNVFKTIKRLNDKGVLGINRRNLDLILRCNPRLQMVLADDKIKTKMLAQSIDLSVPETYGVIQSEAEIEKFTSIINNHREFVIKPAKGSGGQGILIIKNRIGDKFRKSSDHVLTHRDISRHLSKILSGIFSLGGYPDSALIEYRVVLDPFFDSLCYRGVPDIRIIVYYGYPVIAMLRLPTIQSDGRANLHQGAIGVGVRLSDGTTTYGVLKNTCITQHPDTLVDITGHKIPHWSQIMEISAKSYDLTRLGYIGVDLVLDKTQGPMLLELNARPGLNIQIANQCGLWSRIQTLQAKMSTKHSLSDRITVSQTCL